MFGKPPKEVKYGYPMSEKGKKREDIRREAWERAVGELKGVVGDVKVLAEELGRRSGGERMKY